MASRLKALPLVSGEFIGGSRKGGCRRGTTFLGESVRLGGDSKQCGRVYLPFSQVGEADLGGFP